MQSEFLSTYLFYFIHYLIGKKKNVDPIFVLPYFTILITLKVLNAIEREKLLTKIYSLYIVCIASIKS